jgi:crotonobetainyl-CoA:carnitine CoA-transferase CaiB-like acyl-CoA transferase
VEQSGAGVPGYGLFATADGGRVALGVINEQHFWSRLCLELGLDDAAELPFPERMARVEELQGRLRSEIARHRRDDLVSRLLAADVPAAPVLDRAAMTALDHFRRRGVVTTTPWADPASGHPIRFRFHPGKAGEPPPELDEHRGARFA